MKTSVKKSIGLLALALISISVKAQTTSKTSSTGVIYSVGVESGISTGSFRDAHKWNLGGSLQADIPVASQFYFTANAGYDNFFGKDNIKGTNFSAPDIHLIPVMAGLKYFPISLLYIQAAAGAGFLLNKGDLGYNKTAAFLYAPQVGLQFPLGGHNYLDAGVKYEGTTKFVSGQSGSKISTIGLRVAYGFGTK